MGRASRAKKDPARQDRAAAQLAHARETQRRWHESAANDPERPPAERLKHLLASARDDVHTHRTEIWEVHEALIALGWEIAEASWDAIIWDAPTPAGLVDWADDPDSPIEAAAASVMVDVLYQRPLYVLGLPYTVDSVDFDDHRGEPDMYFFDRHRLLMAAEQAMTFRPGDDRRPFWKAFPDALTTEQSETCDRGMQVAVGSTRQLIMPPR
jgi:hypothetical protein